MITSKFIVKATAIALVLASTAGFSSQAQAGGYYGHHYRHGGHHYRHGHHHSDGGAYLAGGLILGSLITHAVYNNRAYRYDEPYVVERRVVRRPATVPTDRSVSRRLFRDRNGNCFERVYTPAGDEVMQELDPQQCAW